MGIIPGSDIALCLGCLRLDFFTPDSLDRLGAGSSGFGSICPRPGREPPACSSVLTPPVVSLTFLRLTLSRAFSTDSLALALIFWIPFFIVEGRKSESGNIGLWMKNVDLYEPYRLNPGWQGAREAMMMFNIYLTDRTGLDLHITLFQSSDGVLSI